MAIGRCTATGITLMAWKTRLLTIVRVSFVAVGAGGAVLVASGLATMPAPPPNSDGFVRGGALLYGGILIVLGLGLAAIGVALPTIVGADDPLGFTWPQRLLLKGALGLIGGGLVLGLVVGLLIGFQFGIALWLVCLIVAVCLVCLTVIWLLSETALRKLSQALTG